MKYLTILNFGSGTVHQYEIEDSVRAMFDPYADDFEEFIQDEGFSLSVVEWMVHNNGEIIKEKIEQ